MLLDNMTSDKFYLYNNKNTLIQNIHNEQCYHSIEQEERRLKKKNNKEQNFKKKVYACKCYYKFKRW